MKLDMRLGDCLDVLPTLEAGSIHCVCTSPPYWGLRSYLPEGHEDKSAELGSEATPELYVAKMVEVFRDSQSIRLLTARQPAGPVVADCGGNRS